MDMVDTDCLSDRQRHKQRQSPSNTYVCHIFENQEVQVSQICSLKLSTKNISTHKFPQKLRDEYSFIQVQIKNQHSITLSSFLIKSSLKLCYLLGRKELPWEVIIKSYSFSCVNRRGLGGTMPGSLKLNSSGSAFDSCRSHRWILSQTHIWKQLPDKL